MGHKRNILAGETTKRVWLEALLKKTIQRIKRVTCYPEVGMLNRCEAAGSADIGGATYAKGKVQIKSIVMMTRRVTTTKIVTCIRL